MNRIGLDEIFRRAIDVVEGESIPYLVYGGLAVPAWGQPAQTQDVDLVVHATSVASPAAVA